MEVKKDSYTGTYNVIASDFISKHNRENIIARANAEGEKPFGYILDYLKEYGLPKTDGWHTAEAICRFYNIEMP